MIELKGRTKVATVEAEAGLSILDHAIKHNIDFSYTCARGTCARCRCIVTEGGEFLEGITDEEWDRLEPEEFEEGYRLGCQAIIKDGAGHISATNKTYF
ncbi:(2Fe-2S)-binding protein [Paenibacillus sp. GSMTC-2017]|uniref:2Fe-2S iron-sulfur cluster-binding protein n=1 Tax=Paenibacillus sp. GSMTC-2017 TaxID=2794350 RepID=UPI0018D762DA|nr:2Fe-2S iron-sulfur cluster-binding protein [Paenibacillus sp. GSMTC-2017]MBH5317970.1 (2Fe-2S)-binding protein [Paenibacillus sp. GSMTC-2017]